METRSSQSNCIVFADPSERAYGAVVYMRVEYEARVKCQIVDTLRYPDFHARVRVAPF